MARLEVVEGPDSGSEFVVEEKTLLGRGPACRVRLTDPAVDEKHALVVDDPRGYVLYDLSGEQSLLVNEEPSDGRLLHEGDRIRLGGTALVYRGGDGAVDEIDAGETQGDVTISESSSAEIFETLAADRTGSGGGTEAEIQERFQKVCHISSVIGLRLGLERILEEALGCFFEVFEGVERGVILLLDPTTGHLAPRMFKKRSEGVDDRIAVPRTILERVTTQRESVVSADAMADDRFSGGFSIQFQRVRFMMCAPLICQDELLGAIYLDSTSMARFSEDDLLLLNGIGAQVAVAIKNAQMNRFLREKEQLERELSIARTIQQSLLPTRIQAPEGWEVAAISQPARRVGGDFFDVPRTSGARLDVVIGDVSGKGIAAALYMAGVLSELRFLLGAMQDIGEVARLANESLVERAMMGMFVTTQILRFDQATGRGHLLSAGHPAPLVLRAGGAIEELTEEVGAPPLGIVGDIPFVAGTFALAPGEVLVLFTDGIFEAASPEGELYGFDRLRSILARPGPAAEVLERMKDDVLAFSGQAGQRDDLTLVVVRRLG